MTMVMMTTIINIDDDTKPQVDFWLQKRLASVCSSQYALSTKARVATGNLSPWPNYNKEHAGALLRNSMTSMTNLTRIV